MLLEPSHCLQECRLLRILHGSIVRISSNSKAVLDTRIEIDLVWLSNLLQDFLGLVPLLCCQHEIGFGGADSKRPFDGFELIVLNKGGMCTVSDVDLTRLQKSNYVLGSEAISDGANCLKTCQSSTLLQKDKPAYLDSIFRFHDFDTLPDDWVDRRW